MLSSPRLPLDFNLSDSREWMALLVSAGPAVGVDIEYCDPAREVMRLARRWFSAGECAALDACPAAARVERFHDLWTLKEAHIKAAGGSLWRDLQDTRIALNYPGGLGTIRVQTPAPVGTARYALLQPVAGYRLALCSTGRGSFASGLEEYELTDTAVRPRSSRLLAVSPEVAPPAEETVA